MASVDWKYSTFLVKYVPYYCSFLKMQTILTPAALPFCYIYQHFVYVATVAVSVECTVTEYCKRNCKLNSKCNFLLILICYRQKDSCASSLSNSTRLEWIFIFIFCSEEQTSSRNIDNKCSGVSKLLPRTGWNYSDTWGILHSKRTLAIY